MTIREDVTTRDTRIGFTAIVPTRKSGATLTF